MKTVREGYKMTELGEIPEEWKAKRLCDIAEINPKKEIIEDDNDVSFIAMEDVSNEGRVIKNNIRKYGEVKKGYTAFKKDDVLLAKITPCFENGKKALVTQLINDIGFGSTEFHVLRANRNDTIPIYIYYTISTNKFMEQAQANMTGSAGQKRVPTEFLKEYITAIPSLEEQEKISLILISVDEQIEITDNLIEKTKELKKGLMQKLLTKGIGHSRFKDTGIGKIPEEWEVVSLDKVSWFQEGPGLRKWQFRDSGIKVINVTNLVGEFLNLNNTSRYLDIDEVESKYKHFLVDSDDIVVASSGNSWGKVSVVRNEDLPLLMNTSVIRFKSIDKDILSREYLLQYLKSDLFKKQISLLVTGSAQPNFGPYHLQRTIITLPSIKEQQQIASILSSVDEQIDQYESKKGKLQELKKGLMQKLLTGNIRVKV
ncbi:MAG: restriction endonuclease subunit S [Clostridium butyricum]|nr:restriction endonuclease subunit S [Clostridium butyricum]